MEAGSKRKKQEDPQEAGWKYSAAGGDAPKAVVEQTDAPPQRTDSDAGSIEWTASEFIAHEKGFGWYAVLTVVAFIAGAGMYFATKDMLSVTVVLIMAIILGVAGGHRPRVITYKVDSAGFTVGNKFYPYSAYKSFSMPEDGPFTSIALVPMRRVAFPVGIYLAPESRDKVLEIVSNHLPLEHGELGAIDHLMRQLRF